MTLTTFLLFFLSLPLFLHFNLTTAQTHVYDLCDPGGNYTANSTFQTNLNNLLSSLSNTSGFLNISSGREPDTVYGLLQCRGDQNPTSCKNCAEAAAESITTKCPYRKESIIFYDECLLHYSNKSFISSVQLDPVRQLYNTANVSDPDRFSPVLEELMSGLVAEAIANSSKLFAAGKQNYTISQSVYGYVQCTQDLSSSDCNRCLTRAISQFPGCCDKARGAQIIGPSCISRYEISEFLEPGTIATPPPPSPLLPPPPVAPTPNINSPTVQNKKSSINVVAIVVPIVVAVVLLLVAVIFFCSRKKKRFEIVKFGDVDEMTSAESLQVDFSSVEAATDNFKETNKLGEGGFGAVYKGIFSDGQEVAVKRLARNSGQGAEEFKNEVLLLAKLQHRNLVRLLGFCLEGNEKILIYEFVRNASLDQFIFDPVKRTSLSWESRYKIIGEIARGLLYLHEDSRDRIIHRDLKASNILLDSDMNPKIADFGMAKLFNVDQTKAYTSRVVGTYGYMAPEYAMRGQFSVKSDVFSFGVLVLEIVSGRRNSSSSTSENSEDLISHVWRQWEQKTPMEILEPILKDRHSSSEVMRCIHMGLLCVQEDPVKRPTMEAIVLMLNSYSSTLPLPSRPAFLFSRPDNNNTDTFSMSEEDGTSTTNSSKWILHDQSTGSSVPQSINDTSITQLEPR